MKSIKNKTLKSAKKVYYFKHANGVLENQKSRKQAAMRMLVALFIFGGVGALSLQVYDMRQGNASNSVQREAVLGETTEKAVDTTKPADQKGKEDDELTKRVKASLKNVPGGQKWSVYMRDVNSDRMVTINADEEYDAAGLSSLLVASPLQSKFDTSKWGYRVGNVTVAKCMELLIAAKETDCRSTIDRYADLKTATGVLNSVGLKNTTLDAKEQKTTARDMGELLFQMQNGRVLNDKARRVAFDGLYGHTKREGIRAGCDQSCLVAEVTGESDKVRHDAAIVTNGDAKYVLVVMTKDASWSQIKDIASEISSQMKP